VRRRVRHEACRWRPEAQDRLLLPLFRRHRQRIVENPELRADLLLQILLLADEVRQRRIARRHAGARCRERLLHRVAADQVGQPERLQRDRFGLVTRGPSQERHVILDNEPVSLVALHHADGIVIDVVARNRNENRHHGSELLQCLRIVTRPG